MNYIFLIYDDESKQSAPDSPESQAIFGRYMQFNEEAKARGVLVAGEPLDPVATASSVRIRNGKTQVTDGPFAETKEQLGGFYILDCKDLDEALEFAAKIPTAESGTIEVRPIMDLCPGGE